MNALRIENHPVIVHIIENHAAIYKRMQAAIRKHRREICLTAGQGIR